MHPRSRKARGVSGGLHRHDASCRQSQALCTRAHGKRGTSQAACTPMMNTADSLRLHPHSRKVWGVSGGLHRHDANCRQSQALCTRTHGKRGTSQAVCTAMMKTADSLRLSAPALTESAGRLSVGSEDKAHCPGGPELGRSDGQKHRHRRFPRSALIRRPLWLRIGLNSAEMPAGRSPGDIFLP